MKRRTLFCTAAFFLFFAGHSVACAAEAAAPADTADGTARISSDVFGKRGGYVHPFLKLNGMHSDNIFNTKENTASDFITVVSPGIWLAAPRVKEELLDIDTSSISSGGLDLDFATGKDFKRYQAYLFYGPDISMYSRYSDENITRHRAEGMLQYNLRGGLTFEFIDQFQRSRDPRGTGISTQEDRYATNFLTFRTSYDITPKLELKADYSNFIVDYSAQRNNYRDRDDDSVSASVFFKFTPKTSAFIEYDYVTVNYDTNTLYDSSLHRGYGGIAWDVTKKSEGRFKIGSSSRDYESPRISDTDEFVMELQLDHTFTPKTSVAFTAFRQNSESNIQGLNSILRNRFDTAVTYRLTSKITTILELAYSEENYDGALTYGGVTKEREDETNMAALSAKYEIKKWLTAGLSYSYRKRDSNFSDFDYSTSVFLINLTAAL